jgi:DNA-nicking Smr family endonuclease
MANKKDSTHDPDLDLFRSEMRDITPLNHEPLHNVSTEKPLPNVNKVTQTIRNTAATTESFSDMLDPVTVGNEEYLEYKDVGIQHRLFTKLRAGKIHIEAELDLHGMTTQLADITLNEFIHDCQQQQIRCARIVHGKGWSSKENKPILKSKLNIWLRQHHSVLAFCSATVPDGGTGALYILFRRQYDAKN